MSFTVRSILGKARLHRPDLREAEIDYLTQEIVKRICRLTMLSKRELTFEFNGPTEKITIDNSILGENELNRIHFVQWQDTVIQTPNSPTLSTISNGSLNGTFLYKVVAVGPQGWVSLPSQSVSTGAITNKTIKIAMPQPPLAPNGFNHFDLYRSSNNGTNWFKSNITFTGGTTTDDGLGIIWTASTLPNEQTGDYRNLGEGNYVDLNNKMQKPESVMGTPTTWAYNQFDQSIYLYPPVSNLNTGCRVKVLVSVVPLGEIEEIPLPPETEEAVYYGTLAEALILPGPAGNPQLAKNYEMKFNFEMSNLKAVSIFGQSGKMTVIPRPLGGRKRVPYNSFWSPTSQWGW